MFVKIKPFHPSLLFRLAKPDSIQGDNLTFLLSKKSGLQCESDTYTVEHSSLLVKTWQLYKSEFYNIEPCGLYYKSCRIVIYNRNDSMIIIYKHNDSGHYYKTINYIG